MATPVSSSATWRGAGRSVGSGDLPSPFGPVRTDRLAQRWFGAALLGLFVVAMTLRIVFTLTSVTPLPNLTFGDQYYYRTYAANLAAGHGISEKVGDSYEPAAAHGPGLPVVLAAGDLVGLESISQQRIEMAVVCSLAVLLIGLVGRRLGGPTLGLLAAAVAAIHPAFVQAGPDLLSEGVFITMIAATMLAALWFLDRPSWRRGLVAGLVVGVTTLTRSEALLLVLLLGLPLALVGGRGWQRRAVLAGSVVVGASVVIVPWLVRNDAAFGGIVLTTNQGPTIAGANCPETYAGRKLGGFSHDCLLAIAATSGIRPEDDVLERGERLQHAASTFVADHASRVPVVAAARLARGWGVFASGDSLAYDVREYRSVAWQRTGQWVHWVLLPLAIAGALRVPRRSWKRWFVPAAPVVMTSLVFVAFFGSSRYRAGSEPSIALFASAGLVALLAWLFPVQAAQTPAEPLSRAVGGGVGDGSNPGRARPPVPSPSSSAPVANVVDDGSGDDGSKGGSIFGPSPHDDLHVDREGLRQVIGGPEPAPDPVGHDEGRGPGDRADGPVDSP